jgi:Protease inhibitor Inh
MMAFVLVAACCSAASAQPQPPGDSAKAMAGTWEFTNADRDKTCTITLRLEPVAGGMRAEFDKACAAKFPFIGEISAWTFAENDFLRLVDSKGGSVLEFNEVEGGVYEAPRPGEGILFIQNAGAAGPPSRTAAEVSGEWSIVRGAGKAVCGLTLSNTAVGEDFAVRVRQPCDALVTRFAPTTWQVERGELVLKPAKGNPWRFEEQDAATWQRIPAAADPVLLVRK